MKRTKIVVWTLFLSIIFVGNITWANPISFFFSESQWNSVTSNWYVEKFDITAENIAKANEVISLPSNNEKLGNTLTFEAQNTGLTWSFELKILQEEAEFVFNDREKKYKWVRDGWFSGHWEEKGEYNPFYEDNLLSVGDVNNYKNIFWPDPDGSYTDDDWSLTILDGPPLKGLSFKVHSDKPKINILIYTISVYGGNNSFISKRFEIDFNCSLCNSPSPIFVGLKVNDPDLFITGIVFDECPGPNDIALSDFRFATTVTASPEPASFVLLGSAFLSLLLIRKIKK